MMQPLRKTAWQFLPKVKHRAGRCGSSGKVPTYQTKGYMLRVTIHPANPPLSTHSREIKNFHTKMCTQMFTATLFKTAKSKNNPNVHQLINE
jgi:hypothetical protein